MNSRSNRKLHSLMRVNEQFLEERSEINAALINSYLAAAMSQPDAVDGTAPTVKDLSKLTDLPYATMSRHLRYLGDRERDGKKGMHLVQVDVNPDNRREKQVFLTHKGEELRAEILRLL